MINFKELVKERDEMQAKIDEVRLRIEKFTDVKEEVPDWLWEEESTYKSYQESIINRIGCELTEEDVAEHKKVVFDLDAEDTPLDEEASDYIEEMTNKLMSGNIILAGDITPLDNQLDSEEVSMKSFNPADILQAIAGVEVSDEDDEEQCGCKYCSSEDDDNTEDILDTIVKAFLVKVALNAIKAKKEGK